MISEKYKDIIGLPCPEPRHHVRMARLKRAAQFAPYDALTGYKELIDKTVKGRSETAKNSLFVTNIL